jgi:integrase
MIYEGADLQTVSDTLGHHSAAFTAKVYAHTIDEAKRKSADKMEKYLDKS